MHLGCVLRFFNAPFKTKKMKWRNWGIGLLVLALLGVGAVIWWRSGSSAPAKQKAVEQLAPKISVASVAITDMDDEKVKLTSKVQLSNPLPLDLRINRVNYAVFIDSLLVLQDAYSQPITIRSSDSTTIAMPMELLAKPMARMLKYFEDNKVDSADYTVKATVLLDVPVAGNRSFSLDISKRLPAVYLPKVKVTDVDLNALRLKKEGVDITVQISNPNAFALKLKDGTFNFQVEDDLEVEGALEQVVNLPARGTEAVSMKAVIKEGRLLKVGWKLLANKNETPFTFNFQCKILSEVSFLNNTTMASSVQGTLGELAAAMKKAK